MDAFDPSDPMFRCEACDEPIVGDDEGLCARCIDRGADR